MLRLALLPISLALACLVAGAYGALHNQISYTVAPTYFHDFKFIQFAIDPDLQNRLGASLVGWNASWWMGFLIGLPIYFAGLLVQGNVAFLQQYARAAIVVVVIALLIGLGALAVSFVTINETHMPVWMDGFPVRDPMAFARAGMMHNYSYAGGLAGLVAGVALMIRAGLKSRRKPPNPQAD